MNLLILHPNYENYHIIQLEEFPLEVDYLISTLQ